MLDVAKEEGQTVVESGDEKTSRARGEFFFEARNVGDWTSRLVFIVCALGLFAVFVTAAMLEPNPLGHSTHTQLGLAPCGFLAVSGLPCPGCGLTTCFSHMVRFEIYDAARANPFGIPLFISFVLAFLYSIVGAWKGWSVMESIYEFHMDWICIGLSACAMVVWGGRIATILIGGV
jgi:hypothetical protein